MSDVAVPEIRVQAPPPPHDPRDRVFLDVVDGWQVRVMEPGGACERYFGREGFGHLQFWYPPSGLSVLTPSELTRHQFEIYVDDNWKYSSADYRTIRDRVLRTFGFCLPRPSFVETLIEVFIESARDTTEDQIILHGKVAMETF